MRLNNSLKYLTGLFICLLIRLIPFRPANVEPLMATLMPFSKRYGWAAAFVFSFLSFLVYDLFTNFGVWTLLTGAAYGLVGVGAYFYFQNREASAKNFGLYALYGTLAYDAVTGLGIGPILFHQTFMQALIGQIPFTARHLIGNVGLAVLVSPAIYRWVVKNPQLELNRIWLWLNQPA